MGLTVSVTSVLIALVVDLKAKAAFLNVVKGQLGRGTLAPALTATFIWVSDTIHELLVRERLNITLCLGRELLVSFQSTYGSDSPTRTTRTLIFYAGGGVIQRLRPINARGYHVVVTSRLRLDEG
jgi:hypothetical protein